MTQVALQDIGGRDWRGARSRKEKKRERRCMMEAAVLRDRLCAQTLTGHLTPLTSTKVRRQWRALLICFREVQPNPPTPPVVF